jgi:hypothetical protein
LVQCLEMYSIFLAKFWNKYKDHPNMVELQHQKN